MRYSLASYILTISIPQTIASSYGIKTISVGGQGSALDSIDIVLNSDMFSTEADSTGAYVHNQSLDRTGSCSVTLNMLSPTAQRFKQLCNIYRKQTVEHEGLTLELSNNKGDVLVQLDDCLIKKLPDLRLGSTAGTQTWTFTCGVIDFKD